MIAGMVLAGVIGLLLGAGIVAAFSVDSEKRHERTVATWRCIANYWERRAINAELRAAQAELRAEEAIQHK
jgi:hypothetical protein